MGWEFVPGWGQFASGSDQNQPLHVGSFQQRAGDRVRSPDRRYHDSKATVPKRVADVDEDGS